VEETRVARVARTLDLSIRSAMFIELIVIDFLLDIFLNPRVNEESINSIWQGFFGWIVLVPLLDHYSMNLERMHKFVHSIFFTSSTSDIEAIVSSIFSL